MVTRPLLPPKAAESPSHLGGMPGTVLRATLAPCQDPTMGLFRRKASPEPSAAVATTTASLSSLAARLPEAQTLIRWSQSMAMLDAILSPEWDMRYFSHNIEWAPSEQMASMRNGSGDEYSFTFMPHGTYGRGFDHESALSPFIRQPPRPLPGLLDVIPNELQAAAAESAFTLIDVQSVTLTLWRLEEDAAWSHGQARDLESSTGDDGGTWLFDLLDGTPETYLSYASDYYEASLNLDAIRHVFEHQPLTNEVVRSLNHEMTLGLVTEDINSIGYP